MFSVTREGFVVTSSLGAKHAVAHPLLMDLPFVKSVETWVRGCFPWAEYLQSDSATIDVPDLTFPGIVALQGVKGLGKSKAIAAAVAALPAETTVLLVTFRRALAWSSLHVLGPTTKVYSDIHGLIVPSEHPRVSVLVNSIGRVAGSYDVVVVDEIVSVIDMLAGQLMESPDYRVNALHGLQTIMRGAKCIVAADAMLDSSCITFLLSCRNAPVPTPLRVHDNVTRIHNDYVYVAHENRKTWEAELAACVVSGQRVVVACMTKAMATQLAAQFADTYAVTSYCSGDDPAVLQTHMLDIHTHWKACQILVYSPVITAGCSFELPHFDVVFFYGKPGLGSVRSAIQMISRVRDVSQKRVHVFIAECTEEGRGGAGAGGGARPASVSSPSAAYRMLPHGTTLPSAEPCRHYFPKPEDVHMQLLEQLERFRNKETTVAAQAFQYHFWYLVTQSGASIVFSHQHLLPIVPHAVLAAAVETCQSTPPRDDDDDDAAGTIAGLMVGQESMLAHGWDGPQLRKRASGGGMKLLQRAAALHYEDAVAANVLEGVVVRDVTADGTPLKAERDARMHSWMFFSAIHNIHVPGFTEEWNAVFSADALRSRTPRTIVHFTAAAMSAKYQPPALAAAVAELLQKNHRDAWILGAMDVSVRGLQPPPVTAAVLLEGAATPEPEPRIPELLNAAIAKLTPVWVGTNVRVSNGMVDVLVEDAVGGWHVVVCRSTGAADCLYDYDLLKGLALCASMPYFDCKSLVFVYLQVGETVTVDVAGWLSYPLRRMLYEARKKEPLPGSDICFMVFDAFGAVTARDPATGRGATFFSVKDAVGALTGVTSRTRVVSWGFRDGYSEQFADSMHDLEYVVAHKLGCASRAKALNIFNARTLHHGSSSDGIVTLMNLYMSVLQNGTLVYFHDLVPLGMAVFGVPSVSYYDMIIDAKTVQ
jgi:hypothetical protein